MFVLELRLEVTITRQVFFYHAVNAQTEECETVWLRAKLRKRLPTRPRVGTSRVSEKAEAAEIAMARAAR